MALLPNVWVKLWSFELCRSTAIGWASMWLARGLWFYSSTAWPGARRRGGMWFPLSPRASRSSLRPDRTRRVGKAAPGRVLPRRTCQCSAGRLARPRPRARHLRRTVVGWRNSDAARLPVSRALRTAGAGGQRRLGTGGQPPSPGIDLSGLDTSSRWFVRQSLRDVGNRVASWLHRAGMRAAPAVEEIWRSYSSLAEADTRRAFFRTLHAVIDLGGQAVTATDRLYLASQVPTLVVWGADDPLISVSHAIAAHEAMPGAASRSSRTSATSRIARIRIASCGCSSISSHRPSPRRCPRRAGASCCALRPRYTPPSSGPQQRRCAVQRAPASLCAAPDLRALRERRSRL